MALPANSPLQLDPRPFRRYKTDATSTFQGGGFLATSPIDMGGGFIAAPGINTGPSGGGFDAPNTSNAFGMGAPQNPSQTQSPQTPSPDPVKQAALYALAVALILLGVWTLVK